MEGSTVSSIIGLDDISDNMFGNIADDTRGCAPDDTCDGTLDATSTAGVM